MIDNPRIGMRVRVPHHAAIGVITYLWSHVAEVQLDTINSYDARRIFAYFHDLDPFFTPEEQDNQRREQHADKYL